MHKNIEIKNIKKAYGEFQILNDFNLTIPRDKIICIVGSSGCGKSTILNIVSGLVKPDGGNIINVDDKLISYVFQEPRLLLWKSAKDNLKYVLKGKVEDEILDSYVENWLDNVGLSEYKDFYPRQMSGGMMQRLALARAFAMPSNLLLMDEPFKGLDAPLRHKMIELLQRLWENDKKTIIFVTHDIQEALLIGHRVVALSGRPAEVLDNIELDMPVKDRKIGCTKLNRIQGILYELIEKGSLGINNCKIKDKYCPPIGFETINKNMFNYH